MKFLALVIVLIGGTLTAAGQENGEWRKFTSAEGHFSVMLPEAPMSDSIPYTHPSGMTFDVKLFLIPGNDNDVATYMIMYIDYPVDLAETALDAARDGALKRSKATLTSEKKISLNGYPGREIEATKEIGTVHFRMFLVGPRLYTVMYGWSKTADRALALKNATKYLESFEIDQPKN